MHDLDASGGSELRIGSLFSGYGGLDLAVEHVFNAKTLWFSELNEPVARVFALARRTVPHPAGDGLIARRRNARPGASEARDDRAVAPDHRLRPAQTG